MEGRSRARSTDLGSYVVDVAVGCGVDGLSCLFDPVDHVCAFAVEGFDLCVEAFSCEGCSHVPVGALFGFELAVAFEARTVVVEVGVGGCAQALVEGGEEFHLAESP